MLNLATSLLPAAISAGSSLFAGERAEDDGEFAARMSRSAAGRQVAGINSGIKNAAAYYNQARRDLEGGVDEAQGYLSPFIDRGDTAHTRLDEHFGYLGPEAQDKSRERYESSPSANILARVREDIARREAGKYAAAGMNRSGAFAESLARRTADLDLGDYRNWEGNLLGYLNTENDYGFRASGASADLARGTGAQLANLATGQGRLRYGAEVDKGTAEASGLIGGTNANLAGRQGMTSGITNALGTVAGFAQGNDFSKFFGKKGDVGLGSWTPSVSFG
jgi:hypothetical protein